MNAPLKGSARVAADSSRPSAIIFWVIEGMGYFGTRGESLEWPGGTWAIVAIFLAWFAVSRITVEALRRLGRGLHRAVSEPDPEVTS